MILTQFEKDRLIGTLSWMVADMKARHDELYNAGNYSPQLIEALQLVKDISAVEPTEEIIGEEVERMRKVGWRCKSDDFESFEGSCARTEGPCQMLDCPYRQFEFIRDHGEVQ
jgi:hypothetical protein